MNKVTDELAKFQTDIQLYAARGLLTCKERNRILKLDVITTLALNIFCLAATIATAGSAPVAVPIILAVATVGLLAWNVYLLYNRISDKLVADSWKPCFEDIIQAKYADAHKKIDDLLASKKRVDLHLEDCRFPQSIGEGYLHCITAILQAFADGKKKTDKEIQASKASMDKWADHMRCGGASFTKKWKELLDEANNLESPAELFKPEPVKFNAALLLLEVISTVKEYLRNHFPEDRFDQWGGGAWSGVAAALNFLKLVQAHEKDNIGTTEKAALDTLLKCRNLKDLYQEVHKISPETLDKLKTQSTP